MDVGADSSRFPKEWLFHYRRGKGRVGNHAVPGVGPITFLQAGGRTSAVVLKVQRKGERKAGQKAEGGREAKGERGGAAGTKRAAASAARGAGAARAKRKRT